jgi:hypothetical protein
MVLFLQSCKSYAKVSADRFPKVPDGMSTLLSRILDFEGGERQPLMACAAVRMGGGGVRPPAGSDTSPRPKAASNKKPPEAGGVFNGTPDWITDGLRPS